MKKHSHIDDAPELTKELVNRLRLPKDVLSPEQYAMLPKKKIGQRGKQKTPIKEVITIRLDHEIVEFFKSRGTGWQGRINDFLKAAVTNLQ